MRVHVSLPPGPGAGVLATTPHSREGRPSTLEGPVQREPQLREVPGHLKLRPQPLLKQHPWQGTHQPQGQGPTG